MAKTTNACVTFDKDEKAHIYDIDIFGSWIVVGMVGRPGRWHSLEDFWKD